MPQPLLLNGLRRTVFEYMEPNFRFHLSLHLPSLRSIEKGTCLKIKELIFKDNTIIINKTEYKLNIDRKYEIENRSRISGTVYHDVDEFGFRRNTNSIMMNGDVRMDNDSNGIEDGFREPRLEDGISGLTMEMKKKETPKCKSTLKLTIKPENGEPWIYTSSKNTKMYEGMKMLIAAIFGNRNVIWNVESMFIPTCNLRWIISGTKPLVQEMKLGCYRSVNLNSLRSICHETSFPLKNLNFEMDLRILDHEILVNAEYLFIYSGMFIYETDYMRQLMKVSNLKVRLFRISAIFFSELMDLWLEHGRPVGTSWSFEIEGSEPSRYIHFLGKNDEVIESDSRSIKLSMGPSSILSVSFGDPETHDNGFNLQMIWTVTMEVLQR